MSTILKENTLRKTIRAFLNEERGVYYDRKLISKILNRLFYLVKYDVDNMSFKYEGYDYVITTKPFLMHDFYKKNRALAGCRKVGGHIEISLNPKLLNKYKDYIKSCDNYKDFIRGQYYTALENRLDYVLAHELTHAQEDKHRIDIDKANGCNFIDSFFLDDEHKKNANKIENDIVYWFNPRELQARISQGYVVVKRQIRTAIAQFGTEFVDSIGTNEIYDELYRATESDYLDKLYNKVLNSSTEELGNVLTKTSPIFTPRTCKLRFEHKRLIGVLNGIIEKNKKKIIKVTGRIKDELNNMKNGKRF